MSELHTNLKQSQVGLDAKNGSHYSPQQASKLSVFNPQNLYEEANEDFHIANIYKAQQDNAQALMKADIEFIALLERYTQLFQKKLVEEDKYAKVISQQRALKEQVTKMNNMKRDQWQKLSQHQPKDDRPQASH